MWEPCQLYVRVHVSRKCLEDFLASTFTFPFEDAGLSAWLADADYRRERYSLESVRKSVNSSFVVADWVDRLEPMTDDYDEATKTWTLATLNFSKSFEDCVLAAAIFRKLGERSNVQGSLLIYGYLCECGFIIASLHLGAGTSAFLKDWQTRAVVSEANAALGSLVDRTSGAYTWR